MSTPIQDQSPHAEAENTLPAAVPEVPPAPEGAASMESALLQAGQRLADALMAENAALLALDFGHAASLTPAKLQASDAFAAAFGATRRTGARPLGAAPISVDPALARALTERIAVLGEENRRLLERAMLLQARVIETIAATAGPRQVRPGYLPDGSLPRTNLMGPMAVSSRA